MAGENTQIDFDNMSDEDFLKLSEEDAANAIASQTPPEEENHEQNQENTEGAENVDGDESSSDDNEFDGSGDGNDANASQEEEGSDSGTEEGSQGTTDPHAGEGKSEGDEKKTPDGEQSKTDPKEKGKVANDDKGQKSDEVTQKQQAAALDFFTKVTAPFKADGKDFSVRTPEDAIRLMQQGVNYSRRMHELKPMRNMHRMLTDHGLNDVSKLSFAIDVINGDKTAITKLLKEKNLDPMDLDPSGEISYQAKSYAGNPQDNAFRDALDNAMITPDGQALIRDIDKTWDEASKSQLRKNPAILGNLMELRQSGYYSKIVNELDYQRTMGYLTDVPFLQAFDQVGEAMKNAGVFGTQPNPAEAANPMGQLQSNTQSQGQPVTSGARKASGAKNQKPNPNLSSTPPSAQANQSKNTGPDFDKMSDEDFLKLPPPE